MKEKKETGRVRDRRNWRQRKKTKTDFERDTKSVGETDTSKDRHKPTQSG